MNSNITLVCGCIHIPYHDQKALNVFLKLADQFNPGKIILAGDIMDCYAVSHFVRDPKRKINFQWEIDQTKKFLQKLRKDHPHTEITYLQGNHEVWLEKYLRTNAKDLAHLDCLELPSLLDLKTLRIDWLEYGEYYELIPEKFVITHGTVVRQKSGASALGEMEKANISGVSFHTHRLGQVFESKYGGSNLWIEGGTLSNLHPEYIKGTPNWQHGFVILTQNKEEIWPELVQIRDGKTLFRGCRISG